MTRNVMQIYEDNEVVCYRAACGCGEPEHDLEIVVDREDGDFSILFTANVGASFWWRDLSRRQRLYKGWIWRIKAIIRLFFTGHVTMKTDFLITSEAQAKDLARCLMQGIEKVKGAPDA